MGEVVNRLETLRIKAWAVCWGRGWVHTGYVRTCVLELVQVNVRRTTSCPWSVARVCTYVLDTSCSVFRRDATQVTPFGLCLVSMSRNWELGCTECVTRFTQKEYPLVWKCHLPHHVWYTRNDVAPVARARDAICDVTNLQFQLDFKMRPESCEYDFWNSTRNATVQCEPKREHSNSPGRPFLTRVISVSWLIARYFLRGLKTHPQTVLELASLIHSQR